MIKTIQIENSKEWLELKQSFGVESDIELLNNAIALLSWVNKEILNDNERIICSMNEKEQTYKELKILILEYVRNNNK